MTNMDSTYLQNLIFTPTPSLDSSIKMKEGDFQTLNDSMHQMDRNNNEIYQMNRNDSPQDMKLYQIIDELYYELIKDPKYLLSKHNVKLNSQTVIVYQ